MSDPLKTTRLAAVALAVAVAIAAAGVGLNALVNEHKDVDHIKKLAPAPTRVEVDVSDIHNAGVAATVGSLALAVFGAIILILNILPIPKLKSCSIRTLTLQAVALLVPVLLTIGAMIPYMIFFTSRSAKVKAFIGDQQLPDAIVKQVQASSSTESEYQKIWYLRLLAIFPWISIFFGLIAVAVIFISSSRASSAPAAVQDAEPASPTSDGKGSTSHVEKGGEGNA